MSATGKLGNDMSDKAFWLALVLSCMVLLVMVARAILGME